MGRNLTSPPQIPQASFPSKNIVFREKYLNEEVDGAKTRARVKAPSVAEARATVE